ncbi:gamma-glutamyl kinase [Bibersteinia trehalosi Y31]|uniref:Glutamate 5-kinase n=2 Tax=Bibersteinia trehalosi TaxID=47735 RepID=W0R7Z4_BIBTR|nr:glutamate 5-kinase [Bibersteinia trehalosi]AHG86425.1 Glutamate 5-kinase [Bibersteinia trehalosi USDA-ARS-USMARC-190]OAQ15065.1 gamma-glutamyl kinase [Bibersteinia trehalosi Y31]
MHKTIVIKLGTSTLTHGTKSLSRPHMLEIVKQMANLHQQGHRLILVTSGAVAAGRDYLGHRELPPTLASKQLLAAVGQSQLIQVWESLFSIYGIKIGQMLLTRADIENKDHFLNARDTLFALLEQGIIPVINENDAVATAEFRIGDNDNLSALVAMLAQAEQLILLTDQQGLFDSDPRKNPAAKLLNVIEKITPEIRQIAGGSGSTLGTGGMFTKVVAADIATRSGVETIIASGEHENVIFEIVNGAAIGTRFLAQSDKIEGRKQWLFGAPPAGSITIDLGAENALLAQHKSLLPAGISAVQGQFARGEVLKIQSSDGRILGLGISRYNSEALNQIKGKKSSEIETLLGYEFGAVVLHRDEMILY